MGIVEVFGSLFNYTIDAPVTAARGMLIYVFLLCFANQDEKVDEFHNHDDVTRLWYISLFFATQTPCFVEISSHRPAGALLNWTHTWSG